MIIDAHQHFYEPGTPRAKGPEDYKMVALPEGVAGTILLTEQEVGLKLAAEEPLILGIIGKVASSTKPEFSAEIKKWATDPLFRGIRHTGKDLEAPSDGDELFFSNMELLAKNDLVLDVFRVCEGGFGGPKSVLAGYTGSPRALAMLEKVAERVPNLRIVVSHIAHCPIDGKPMPQPWKEKFQKMAAHPNIYMKVSGLMERALWRSDDGGFPNERAPEMLGYYRPTLDALWEIFGEDHLMYGSDWPVCEHAGDFIGHGLRIVRQYFTEKGDEAYNKFLWKNSIKLYKWKPRTTSQQ
ncbi:MAG: amidohydrolase family protein [Candidatus Micrarchaeaceae archaeon]